MSKSNVSNLYCVIFFKECSKFTSKKKVSSKWGLLVFFFTFVFFWSDLRKYGEHYGKSDYTLHLNVPASHQQNNVSMTYWIQIFVIKESTLHRPGKASLFMTVPEKLFNSVFSWSRRIFSTFKPSVCQKGFKIRSCRIFTWQKGYKKLQSIKKIVTKALRKMNYRNIFTVFSTDISRIILKLHSIIKPKYSTRTLYLYVGSWTVYTKIGKEWQKRSQSMEETTPVYFKQGEYCVWGEEIIVSFDIKYMWHSELPGRSNKWHGGIGVTVLPADQRQPLALYYPGVRHKDKL